MAKKTVAGGSGGVDASPSLGNEVKYTTRYMCAAGGVTNIWRPHAVGEGGVFRGSHAIGPGVDNKWLTLG